MRIHRREPIALLILLSALPILSCRDKEAERFAEPDRYSFAVGRAVLQEAVNDSQVTPASLRTIGANTGSLAFSRIGPSAGNDTLLAVVTPMECQVSLIDLRTASVIRKIGRCGAGPGEFGAIQGIALMRDSLIIWDRNALKLIVVDMNGVEGRRFSPPIDEPDPSISSITALTDSTLLLVHDLSNLSPPRDLLVVIDARTGDKVRTFLPSAPIYTTNKRTLFIGVGMCASRTGYVAAMNPWKFEVVTFHGDSTPLFHTITDVPWLKHTELAPNEWDPVGIPYIACADSFYVAKYSALQRDESGLPIETHIRVEARTYPGRLLYSFGEEPVTHFRGRIVEATGDRVFFANNNAEPYPVLIEYQFR